MIRTAAALPLRAAAAVAGPLEVCLEMTRALRPEDPRHLDAALAADADGTAFRQGLRTRVLVAIGGSRLVRRGRWRSCAGRRIRRVGCRSRTRGSG